MADTCKEGKYLPIPVNLGWKVVGSNLSAGKKNSLSKSHVSIGHKFHEIAKYLSNGAIHLFPDKIESRVGPSINNT